MYEKKINIFTDEQIKEIVSLINNKDTKKNQSVYISLEELQKQDYNLVSKRYITIETEEYRRTYKDILNDLNRVIRQRNICKCTINESLAKSIGLDVDLYKKEKENSKIIIDNLKDLLKSLGVSENIEKSDYISFSKNKNEFKFENNSKEDLSHILIMIFAQWKSMIYFLNLEENRYLNELRDVLLPDLMSGKIDVESIMV